MVVSISWSPSLKGYIGRITNNYTAVSYLHGHTHHNQSVLDISERLVVSGQFQETDSTVINRDSLIFHLVISLSLSYLSSVFCDIIKSLSYQPTISHPPSPSISSVTRYSPPSPIPSCVTITPPPFLPFPPLLHHSL